MKNRLNPNPNPIVKIIKIILTAFLVWLGLMIVSIVAEIMFGISQKLDWFPVVALLGPVFCAVLSIVWSLRSTHSPKTQDPLPSAKAEQVSGKRTPEQPILTQGSGTAPAFDPLDPSRKKNIMEIIDEMEGHDFERFCAELLDDCGFRDIYVTPASGDQGVDIVALKHGMRYAFQCKRYSSKIGNTAIQEVNAGKMVYSCLKAVVITNSYFTAGAERAARATGVELWDRDVLLDKINRVFKQSLLYNNKQSGFHKIWSIHSLLPDGFAHAGGVVLCCHAGIPSTIFYKT